MRSSYNTYAPFSLDRDLELTSLSGELLDFNFISDAAVIESNRTLLITNMSVANLRCGCLPCVRACCGAHLDFGAEWVGTCAVLG